MVKGKFLIEVSSSYSSRSSGGSGSCNGSSVVVVKQE